MSFLLELDVPDATWEDAERLERATSPAGYLPVRAHPRRRWLRPARPRLILHESRDGVDVLSDNADWSEKAFRLDERGRELLARTVALLAENLRPGWGLQAYWDGDDCQEERNVSRDELVKLVRASSLDRSTRYRVR